jgi:hypothetical protein
MNQTKGTVDQLSKFLQLDGATDDMDNESSSMSSNTSMSNTNNNSNTNKPSKSEPSSLKNMPKVVLNQELLSSYGLTLSNSQQFSSMNQHSVLQQQQQQQQHHQQQQPQHDLDHSKIQQLHFNPMHTMVNSPMTSMSQHQQMLIKNNSVFNPSSQPQSLLLQSDASTSSNNNSASNSPLPHHHHHHQQQQQQQHLTDNNNSISLSMMTSKQDMPKSYSNRSNLIKNIMSQSVFEQVNRGDHEASPKKRAHKSSQEPTTATTTSDNKDFSSPSSSGPPTFNSESNTLLKALLQSAPKNAVLTTTESHHHTVPESSDVVTLKLPIQPAPVNELPIVAPPPQPVQKKAPSVRKPRPTGQKKQTKMLLDLKNKILDSSTLTAATITTTADPPVKPEPLIHVQPPHYSNPNTIASMTSVLSTFKQENCDSNDATAAAALRIIPNQKQPAQPRKRPSKSMKTHLAGISNQHHQNPPNTTEQHTNSSLSTTTNHEKSDLILSKVFTDLNSFGSFKLSQPASCISVLSINFPERSHSNILKTTVRCRGKIFNLNVEQIANHSFEDDKKLIDNILLENERYLNRLEKKNLSPNSSLLAVAAASDTVNANQHKDQTQKIANNTTAGMSNKSESFRICQLILNEPLSFDSIKNRVLVKNSCDRLNEALLAPQQSVNHSCDNIEMDTSDHHHEPTKSSHQEYLKKTTAIKCTFIQNQPSTSCGNDETSNGAYSEEVVSPAIDIQMVDTNVITLTPTLNNIDQSTIKQHEQQQKPILKHRNTTETTTTATTNNAPLTLQHLMNTSQIKSCKLCGSFLVDLIQSDQSESSVSSSDENEDHHHRHHHGGSSRLATENKENVLASVNSHIGAETLLHSSSSSQCIQFCSNFCKSSYKKLLIIRKRKQESKVKASEEALANSQSGKILNDSQRELEEKKVIKWSTSLTNLSVINNNNNKFNSFSLMPSTNKTFEILRPTHCTDIRKCIFCGGYGDQDASGMSRLLVVDVDKWCHLNCALWSDEVYETMNGALVNVDLAFRKSANVECCYCRLKGASLKCFGNKCGAYYHFMCAVKDKCAFNKDKTIFCPIHASKMPIEDRLTDLSAQRNIWINRDEVAQIQSFMSRDFDEVNYAMRIGSLILQSIGQLLPHQLNSGLFNTRDFIYPVGYRATRFYWSPNKCFKRCRYICSINDSGNNNNNSNSNDSSPEFSVTIIDEGFEPETLRGTTASAIWQIILDKIEKLRRDNDLVKLFPVFFNGEYLFGLSEPHIIRLIESLPGVETLTNYAFKFGRLQLLDMPLTINPSGCARTEPKLRTHFRKSHTTVIAASNHSSLSAEASKGGGGGSVKESGSSTPNYYNEADEDDYDDNDQDDYGSSSSATAASNSSETISVSYIKQFTLSKSSQFKKLRAEWRMNCFLKKSAIQGLGLYAGRDLEKNTMIIEYIGELIRNEVANRREKVYSEQNRGIYMFRLNDDLVVDATISGGLARYINHCCDPNCIAETVALNEKEEKIIIIASKKILKGEEVG